MKALVRSLVQLGKHQTSNLKNLLAGRPVLQPGFVGRTLAPDDLELASTWLEDRTSWTDTSIIRGYERAFATFNGSRHAVAFGSGRESLSACLAALALPPGAEVILPGYTCVVVPNAIEFAGLAPVFVDVELETYGMDIDALRRAIGAKTGAILLHHLYGLVCRDYLEILDLAAARGIPVIEDCAHSAGASLEGIKVGNRGTLAFYSSEQSKAFCSVQGGMAVTADAGLAARLEEIATSYPLPDPAWTEKALLNVFLLYYRWNDKQRWWRHDWANFVYGKQALQSTSDEEMRGRQPAGYGRQLAPPLAALAQHQLGKLPRINEERRAGASRWDRWCDERAVQRPLVVAGSEPIFLRYPILVDSAAKKRDLSWAVREFGFAPGVWFCGSTHPVHRDLPHCPRANLAVAQCINLPTLMP